MTMPTEQESQETSKTNSSVIQRKTADSRTISRTATAKADSLLVQRTGYTASSKHQPVEEQNKQPPFPKYSQATFPGAFGYKIVKADSNTQSTARSNPLSELRLNSSIQMTGPVESRSEENQDFEKILETAEESGTSESDTTNAMNVVLENQLERLRNKKKLSSNKVVDSLHAVHRDTIRADTSATSFEESTSESTPNTVSVQGTIGKVGTLGAHGSVVLSKSQKGGDEFCFDENLEDSFLGNEKSRTLDDIDEENKSHLASVHKRYTPTQASESKESSSPPEIVKRTLQVIQYLLKDAHRFSMANRSQVLEMFDELAAAGPNDHMKLWKLQAATQLKKQSTSAVDMWKATKEDRDRMVQKVHEQVVQDSSHKEPSKEGVEAQHEMQKLLAQYEAANGEVEQYKTELEEMQKKYSDDISVLKSGHAEELSEQKKSYESKNAALFHEMEVLKTELSSSKTQKENFDVELNSRIDQHNIAMDALKSEFTSKMQQMEADFEAKLKGIRIESEKSSELQVEQINTYKDLIETRNQELLDAKNESKQRIEELREAEQELNKQLKAKEDEVTNMMKERQGGSVPLFLLFGTLGVASISWYLGWLQLQQTS